MKVFLHIGCHKTGTTALQDFAMSNRQHLLDNGIFYPGFDLVGMSPMRSHWLYFNDLCKPVEKRKFTDPKAFLISAREKAKAHGCDILLSSEALFRYRPHMVEMVCDLLKEVFAGDEIIVACALRPQVQLADSLYRNAYRMYLHQPPAFKRWLSEKDAHFQYETVVSSFVQKLDATPLLLPYTKETRSDILLSYIRAMGVDPSAMEAPPRQKNPSLDVIDCLAKRRVLGEKGGVKRSKAFNEFVFSHPQRSNYTFMTPKFRAMLEERVRPGNQKLIGMVPSLASALGDGTSDMELNPVDDTCRQMARARAAEFLENRRQRKLAKAAASN